MQSWHLPAPMFLPPHRSFPAGLTLLLSPAQAVPCLCSLKSYSQAQGLGLSLPPRESLP